MGTGPFEVLGRDPPRHDHLVTSLRKGPLLRPGEVQRGVC